jgi:hypothetical protein
MTRDELEQVRIAVYLLDVSMDECSCGPRCDTCRGRLDKVKELLRIDAWAQARIQRRIEIEIGVGNE